MTNEIVDTLIRSSLAISITILALLACRQALRRMAGANLAYVSWLLVPMAALGSLMPTRTIIAPLPDVPTFEIMPATVHLLARAKAAAHPEPAIILTTIWICGCLLFAIGIACLQAISLRRLLPLLPALRDTRTFIATDARIGPAVIGALSPRIVLPADFHTRFTIDEQNIILEHEHIHLRRRDPIVNALTTGLQCLFWFNPLVHIGAHFMRRDQEMSCDATVMQRRPVARKIYAEALLKSQLTGPAIPFGCHWPPRGKHPLVERLEGLKDASPTGIRRTVSIAAICVAIGSVGLSAWASQAPLYQGPKLVPGDPRLANSGFVNFFDATSPVDIEGVIVSVQWLEPRAFIYVEDAEGQLWAGMGDSPASIDIAMHAKLVAGTSVRIEGYRAWDTRCNDGCVINIRRLTPT